MMAEEVAVGGWGGHYLEPSSFDAPVELVVFSAPAPEAVGHPVALTQRQAVSLAQSSQGCSLVFYLGVPSPSGARTGPLSSSSPKAMNGHSDAFGSYNLCGTSGELSAYPSSFACSNGALDLCEMDSLSKMSDCWEGTSEELMMGTVPAPALFLPGPLLPFLLRASLPLSLPLYGRERRCLKSDGRHLFLP